MRNNAGNRQKGMTMVELLVAVTVLGLLSGAIAAVMVAQIRSSASQQSQSAVHSDVNLALTMMRWDMAHVGFAQPARENTVIASVAPAGQGDNITLAGAITGADHNRWTVVMDTTQLNPDQVLVRRWTGNDEERNIRENDTIFAISALKQRIATTWIKSIDETNVPVPDSQLLLTLNDTVSMLAGSVIYQTGTFGALAVAGTAAYTLDAANRRLLRNGQPLLDNVEQFQVRYFFDQDGDGVIDTTAEFQDVFGAQVDPVHWNFTPLLIGVTIVTSPPAFESRQVDFRNTVDIWDSSYPLDPMMQRRYRNVHTMLVRPRNIGG